ACIKRLRPLPLLKAGVLRVGAMQYPKASEHNLTVLHLCNTPYSDGRPNTGFQCCATRQLGLARHDVARDVGLENGDSLRVSYLMLKLLLDHGLADADARGRLTQGSPVDDGMIGIQGERRIHIPSRIVEG